jgi:hypothetical protein
MADINDPAIIQLAIAGVVGILRTVEATAYGEREVGPG